MERPVEATTIVAAPWAAVGELLCRHPIAAIGTSAVLEATLGHGPSVRRPVAVGVGRPSRSGAAVTVPVDWAAEAREDLFPTFDGRLVAEPSVGGTRLLLAGTYAVPLGLLGRFGDGLLGRRVAQQSVARWLEDLARRLDEVVDGNGDGEYEVTVSEPTCSELYIG